MTRNLSRSLRLMQSSTRFCPPPDSSGSGHFYFAQSGHYHFAATRALTPGAPRTTVREVARAECTGRCDGQKRCGRVASAAPRGIRVEGVQMRYCAAVGLVWCFLLSSVTFAQKEVRVRVASYNIQFLNTSISPDRQTRLRQVVTLL